MCCIKPLGNCTKWSLLAKNFSPNVIFLWFRGYLSALLWIRVIIMTVIYHPTVAVQVLVNRRFRMIEYRINHITFSRSGISVSQSRSREWMLISFPSASPHDVWSVVRHLWCRCFHQDLWQSPKLILVSLSLSVFLSLTFC